MKYYVVINGRKPGIYTSWEECKNQVHGYSGAIYKSFNTQKDAVNYLYVNGVNKCKSKKLFTKKGNSQKMHSQKVYTKPDKYCLLCSKPIKTKTKICHSCKNKQIELNKFLQTYHNKKIFPLNQTSLIYIKEKNHVQDVFNFLYNNPNSVFCVFDKDKKAVTKKMKVKIREQNNCKKFNDDEIIPLYIKKELEPDRIALSVDGTRKNPNVYFKCKKCNEEFRLPFNKLKNHTGHQCKSTISSGEFLVLEFLKDNNIKFKTQRDTLKCINPETKRQLPYDFEISNKKIIIEVQGEQHRKFIPRFHITEDNFEYQKEKDKYKKEYAINNGYKFIELWYEDIKSEKYKNILKDALNI